MSTHRVVVACLGVGSLATAWTHATAVRAAEPVVSGAPIVADDRDQWTLLYRHPANRQLFEQLALRDANFRIGPRQGPVTALADVNIGTQQVLDDASQQSRYHGWFVADTFLSVRPVAGIDANLNLLLLNPSASDGYRLSSSVHPGLNLHLYGDAFTLDRHPLRIDVMGTDLGWVTTGNGLLLESLPMEGVLGTMRWKHWELKYLFSGRAYWDDDDFETISLSALAQKVQVNLVNWQKFDPTAGVVAPALGQMASSPASTTEAYSMQHAYYATLATRWPITNWARLATEFGYRMQTRPRVGALGRLDVLVRERQTLAIHLGYQFRYYQAGFGPHDRVMTPTWVFNTPQQQDAYVTNPFEYFGISPGYDQWSHSVVGEGRARIGLGLELYTNTELVVRYARSKTVPKYAVFTADGFRAPGQATHFYYTTGLRYYPWARLPHRLSLSATNKQVQAHWNDNNAVDRRFVSGNFWVLQGEMFL
jgi:hypothetical protein